MKLDRLPAINKTEENNTENGELHCSPYTMEEYVDSIKELSQPAQPLHGLLRGHCHWMEQTHWRGTTVAPSIFLNFSRTHALWIPGDMSDVSITFTGQANWLITVFSPEPAGQLGWTITACSPGMIQRYDEQGELIHDLMNGFPQLSLQRALISARCCMILLCGKRSTATFPKWYSFSLKC